MLGMIPDSLTPLGKEDVKSDLQARFTPAADELGGKQVVRRPLSEMEWLRIFEFRVGNLKFWV